MNSVVPRTNPAVHSGPRAVTSGRISPGIENALPLHADAVQGQRHEGVGLDLVFRETSSMSSMW